MLTVTHNDTTIPQLGFGTWPMKGAECQRAVEAALQVGYRHLDTAQMYENEEAVGAGLRASGLDRDQVFLTTKIWPDHFQADAFRRAVDQRLEKLGVDAVDLLLLHWPSRDVPLAETIGVLNEAHRQGKARAIGISNFTVALIDEAVALSDAPLAVNQVEFHPFLDQRPVLEACRRHGLGVTAYCPIAKGKVNDNPVIQRIADAHNCTPVQVTLRWILQQGVIAIPKSATPERIKANFEAETIDLKADEMAAISGLHEPGGRMVNMYADWLTFDT